MPPKGRKRYKGKRSSKPKAPPGQPVSGPHGFGGSKPSKPSKPKPRPDRPDRPDRHHPPVSTPKPTPARPVGMPPVLTHTPSAGFGGGKPSIPSPISSGVDPGLAAAVGSGTAHPGGSPTLIGHGPGLVDPALAAAAGIGPAAGGFPGTTVGAGVGVGGTGGISDVQDLFPILGETPPLPDEDDKPPKGETEEEKKLRLQKERDEKDAKAKEKSITTAKQLTEWWANESKKKKLYEKYRERKNIFTGKLWGSQKDVTDKIADKLSKGYYKIVKGPKGQPLIIHASTGTPVNPFTGHIIDTQSDSARGGGYQNEMARITGIDPEHAGVFSTEYQRGNGLSVSEMKPEHALRFLMNKNRSAFEQFYNLNKGKKGFNPFSISFINSMAGSVMNMITGPEALQVGNNLERAGWGKAIENKDGSYSIKLTEKGAQGWSDSFNFDTVKIGDNDPVSGFTLPSAIDKDQSKGWLSELVGTKKFPDQPIDLTNLIGQGGYQGEDPGQTMGPVGMGFTPEGIRGVKPEDVQDLISTAGEPSGAIPPKVDYGWVPPIEALGSDSPLPGTPPSQYPQFTPEGTKISGGAYTAPSAYSGAGGGGGGGGEPTPDPTQPPTQGPLTFDVYGRPIKKYDYTGGPEQLYLGGGWKKDGTYIGSPWGPNFKDGGIANFRPYGY